MMDAFLLSLKFSHTHADNNLYVLMVDQDICILVLYVDDLLLTGSSMELIGWVQSQLTSCFSMTDLGLLHYFLGLEIWQHKTGIFLSQKKDATKLLEKYGMQNCASHSCPLDPNSKLSIDDESLEYDSTAYRQLIGSLLYMVNSRPNLAYAMSILANSLQSLVVLIGLWLNVCCAMYMVLYLLASIIVVATLFLVWMRIGRGVLTLATLLRAIV